MNTICMPVFYFQLIIYINKSITNADIVQFIEYKGFLHLHDAHRFATLKFNPTKVINGMSYFLINIYLHEIIQSTQISEE